MSVYRDLPWSAAEKKVARRAFGKAYTRECDTIREHVENLIREQSESRHIWRVHDYLDQKRQETDAKYDYRYSVLILVFARLLRQGWLEESDLEGLDADKITAIKSVADV